MMLIPIFAGRDSEGSNLFILYQEESEDLQFAPIGHSTREVKPQDAYFLRLPDGELHALAPGSQFFVWAGVDINHTHMKIVSGVWTGELRGSKLDLIEARIIDRNRDDV